MAEKDQNLETRERLLEAAGEVFAEHGFRNATIREICDKAKANIAAVNYHFGDKEELYLAVFDYARKFAIPLFEEHISPTLPAEARLRTFVHFTLTRFYDEGRPAWLGKLIARETIEPTKALDTLVKNQIRPNIEQLRAIVRELLAAEINEQELQLVVFSIAAQWLFYFHCRQVIKRINPDQRFGPDEIEKLADHITKFSVTALKGWKS